MSLRFLPPVIKKIGYILLIIAVSSYFVSTSGLLMVTFFRKSSPAQYFTVESVCGMIAITGFVISILFIGLSRSVKQERSIFNSLLLPHYFKYVGYVYLLLTIVYSIPQKYYHSKTLHTTTWDAGEMLDWYKKELTDKQKEAFDKLQDGAKITHSSTVIIDPITLILPIGLLFLAFAKEKVEDELISNYRTQSLQLAVLLLFFIILYQTFHVPAINTLIVTGKAGTGYFDVPGDGWKADVLINIILAFCILRMEFMLRVKPLFSKIVAP